MSFLVIITNVQMLRSQQSIQQPNNIKLESNFNLTQKPGSSYDCKSKETIHDIWSSNAAVVTDMLKLAQLQPT